MNQSCSPSEVDDFDPGINMLLSCGFSGGGFLVVNDASLIGHMRTIAPAAGCTGRTIRTMTQTPTQVALHELRKQLGIIVTAAEHGRTVTILRNGRPVARIVPIDDEPGADSADSSEKERPWHA